MKLYHYTSLIDLPSILTMGITCGEIPVDPDISYADAPKAANLTTNDQRNDQLFWTQGAGVDKARVRLTVDISEQELTSFRQIVDRFKIRTKHVKILAPYSERKHWFYAFAGVSKEQIVAVDVWEGTAFRRLEQPELDELLSRIIIEKDRAIIEAVGTSGRWMGMALLKLKPGVSESWLLDNVK